jgi:hypothetical protein
MPKLPPPHPIPLCEGPLPGSQLWSIDGEIRLFQRHHFPAYRKKLLGRRWLTIWNEGWPLTPRQVAVVLEFLALSYKQTPRMRAWTHIALDSPDGSRWVVVTPGDPC